MSNMHLPFTCVLMCHVLGSCNCTSSSYVKSGLGTVAFSYLTGQLAHSHSCSSFLDYEERLFVMWLHLHCYDKESYLKHLRPLLNSLLSTKLNCLLAPFPSVTGSHSGLGWKGALEIIVDGKRSKSQQCPGS